MVIVIIGALKIKAVLLPELKIILSPKRFKEKRYW
jgi:hypothetical protein